jgi:cytochrome c oxidase cbb3-type subunit 3
MTSFWSGWVIFWTTLTLVIVALVLLANRKDLSVTTDKTTGHPHDDIEELDNPLPAWWFYMFVITIVWGVAYLIIYPGMGNFAGALGWTSAGQHQAEVEAAEERYREIRDRYLALPVEEIAGDPKVRKMGARLFGTYCAQCHGAKASGSYGFPNLTDDDWLYGGDPAAIKTTVTGGRQGAMPAWIDILRDKGIAETTAYVLSLSGSDEDPDKVAKGEKHFKTYCAACHGPDAKGNQALGAPNLTNGIWLYGGGREQIAHTLRAGRNGQMPAFGETLSEDKIHILTAYVYGLSR